MKLLTAEKFQQLLHIHRLKEYIDRDPEERGITNIVHAQVVKPERVVADQVPSRSFIRNSEVLRSAPSYYKDLPLKTSRNSSPTLTPSPLFSQIFPSCALMYSMNELTPGTQPIKQSPRRLGPQKIDLMR